MFPDTQVGDYIREKIRNSFILIGFESRFVLRILGFLVLTYRPGVL